MKNKDLRWFFDAYNKTYFGGKLSRKDIILEFSQLKKRTLGRTDFWSETKETAKPIALLISKELKSRPIHALITLLHEMCHLKLGPKSHCTVGKKGTRFHKEIARLFKAGAYKPLL
jgi:hypothetical protein